MAEAVRLSRTTQDERKILNTEITSSDLENVDEEEDLKTTPLNIEEEEETAFIADAELENKIEMMEEYVDEARPEDGQLIPGVKTEEVIPEVEDIYHKVEPGEPEITVCEDGDVTTKDTKQDEEEEDKEGGVLNVSFVLELS